MALAVPLSRFTSRVGGGSAFYVRHFRDFDIHIVMPDFRIDISGLFDRCLAVYLAQAAVFRDAGIAFGHYQIGDAKHFAQSLRAFGFFAGVPVVDSHTHSFISVIESVPNK